MEYIIKILADFLKPTKTKLPVFGFIQLQPVYVKNIKELNQKNISWSPGTDRMVANHPH